MSYLEAIIHERYEQAVALISGELKQEPTNTAHLNCRAAALFKLGRLNECEADCKEALRLSPDNIDSVYWHGACLFYQGEFEQSLGIFNTITNRHPKAASWIRKCEAELPTIKAISHDWTQTESTVLVTVRAPSVPKSACNVKIGEREISVTINQPSGKDYLLALDLFDRIDKEKSNFEVSHHGITITLTKINAIKWNSLQYKEAEQHNYPTSSKVKKDWSKIDRQCDAELRSEKDTGEAALNNFFREIYGNADEATRRAMIKSFQTSGGTVLSTNWDEVKAADYEGKDRPDAPEGQIWKK